MKLTTWFPTALGESHMPDADKVYHKTIPHINKIIETNGNKCFNYYQVHKDKKLNTINNWVIKEVQKFSDAHVFGKIKIEDSWFNNYKKLDSNAPHAHIGSVFTAVYFLIGHLEDTSLIIHNPNPSDMMNPRKTTPKDPQRNMSNLTFEDIVIKPSTGYLCIFRSFLWHQVPTKDNDLPRLSIAYTFNVC